jgi:hypothetical protein
VWADANNDAAICNGAAFGHFGWRDKEDGVAKFDSIFDALGQAAKFIGKRLLDVVHAKLMHFST